MGTQTGSVLVIPLRAKVIAGFGICGFLVAILALGTSYWLTGSHISFNSNTYQAITNWMVILCPPSLGVMATENAPMTGVVAIMISIVFVNTLLYGIVGWIVTLLLPKRWG